MSAADETRKIGFPEGFIDRLRKVIPHGSDRLLDDAIRKIRLHDALRQLHSKKDVRKPATTWERFSIELIYISVSREHRCSDETIQLMQEIAKAAEITRLHDELYNIVYGRTP